MVISMERSEPHAVASIWQGHQIRLRPVEPDDWRQIHAWNQDDQVSRLADVVPFPESAEAVRQRIAAASTQEPSNDRFRWVMVADDDHLVGSINSHSCDRRVGSFSFGLALAPHHQGHGYASEAIRLVLRYFFEELGYQKVYVHVYEFNQASRTLHERLGFIQEGRLRRMNFTAGQHWDVLVYGMTREEFAAEQHAKLPVFPIPETADSVE